MKLKLLIALLIISVNAFSANMSGWKKIYDSENYDIYIQDGSERPITNPNITSRGFTFIDMINNKKAPEGSDLVVSVTHIGSVDCNNPGYKSQGGYMYKKHYMGGPGQEFGGSVWVDMPKANEQTKKIFEYFCSK